MPVGQHDVLFFNQVLTKHYSCPPQSRKTSRRTLRDIAKGYTIAAPLARCKLAKKK
jgi:hypothetical protein